MSDAPSGLRIGTTEREAAMKALEAHLVAGRLELDEYGERSAKASLARTTGELSPLFADLPLPHAEPAVSLSKANEPAPSAQVRQHSTGPLGGPLFGRFGERLVALSPFVALVLFFLLHTWLVFLLVPISGALIYGNHQRSHGHRREHDERHRERDERRARRPGEY